MSAHTRRLIMAHTIIACTAMVLCTVLAALHDIDGSAALAVILGAAGIGGSGAASAAAVDRGYRGPVMRAAAPPARDPGE